MNIKRFLKKNFVVGPVQGHIIDALQKKLETGNSFIDCLGQSVKETFTEDLPGTSHIYEEGKKDGRVQGTVEQAKRDEIKMRKMQEEHDKDRKHWEEIDRKKDELLDDMANRFE